MKKIIILCAALLCMANSGCDNKAEEKQIYLVVDKDKSVGSHFNPFHEDNFEVGTDYYIIFRNMSTKKVFVHKCRTAEEYYSYTKGGRYKSSGFYEERRY